MTDVDAQFWRSNVFSTARYLFFSAIVFGAYVISARAGLSLDAINGFATLIWLPTGIAIFALLTGGLRLWPAVALGALIVNHSIGAPPAGAFGIALGNTLEACIGAYALKRSGFDWSFSRLRDVCVFILIALAAPIASATIGVGSLIATQTLTVSSFAPTWFAWWMGDAVGAIAVVPFTLTWLAKPPRTLAPPLKILEWLAAGALLIAMSIIAFWTPLMPQVYPLAIPLGWAALRGGVRGATLSVMVFAIIGVIGTMTGHGVFAYPWVQNGVYWLQFALFVAESVFLILASLVTERASHIRILERDLDRIKSEERAKNEFIATLAHELRNPLAPILSTFEYIRLAGAADAGDLIQSAETQAQIMRRLLDDLLDIARVTRQEFRLEKQPTVLQDVLKQSLRSVEQFASTRGHALEIQVPDEEFLLTADRIRLAQIFTNLLFNAAKYTAPGGRISLTAHREGKEAVVDVSDTGEGIAPEMLERIFEPFISVRTNALSETGLGIGLALTRRLVGKHGGSIIAQSAGLGAGSTFVVRLPLNLENADQEQNRRPQENAPHGAPATPSDAER